MKSVHLHLLFLTSQFCFVETTDAQNNFRISVPDSLKEIYTDSTHTFSIGNRSPQEKRTYNLLLTNLSDTPLVVTHATWGEPMFNPAYSKEPVLKGKTTVISYTKMPIHTTGTFMKYAKVYTNLGDFLIRFNGNLLPLQ